ncbi:hypothetical protein LCGC14_1192140 [marine sediment metagenome]|uniref:Uncharacterized protein n=1 Tax=marine sediment metagenome TaxID=412755 RepID=A0A0F9LJ70_9ZZZZ
MINRILIDLSFPDPSWATALYNHAKAIIDHAETLNPGTIYEERGHILSQECTHADPSPGPCIILAEEWTPSDPG